VSVASASLVVALSLTAFAGANWLWLRVDPETPAGYLSALADWALVALALHALALILTGTTSPGAYGLTVVLASAAAAVRRPPAGGVRRLSPPEGRFVVDPVEERAPRRTTLWSDAWRGLGARCGGTGFRTAGIEEGERCVRDRSRLGRFRVRAACLGPCAGRPARYGPRRQWEIVR
jgi:hypothetical protein